MQFFNKLVPKTLTFWRRPAQDDDEVSATLQLINERFEDAAPLGEVLVAICSALSLSVAATLLGGAGAANAAEARVAGDGSGSEEGTPPSDESEDDDGCWDGCDLYGRDLMVWTHYLELLIIGVYMKFIPLPGFRAFVGPACIVGTASDGFRWEGHIDCAQYRCGAPQDSINDWGSY